VHAVELRGDLAELLRTHSRPQLAELVGRRRPIGTGDCREPAAELAHRRVGSGRRPADDRGDSNLGLVEGQDTAACPE
jgi:hypothetical protein